MTCGCLQFAKTGLSVAVKIVAADRASKAERRRRLAICLTCELCTQNLGQYVLTCGRLFDGSPRDEQADGCGCVIMIKAALSDERCPRGCWESRQSSPPLNNSLQ